MGYRTDRQRVVWLGTARAGTGHWWSQRLTSIALVPLTLFFLSGNFFVMPDEDWPTVIRAIAAFFPVKHLNDALLTALNPHTSGIGIALWDLMVILLWGLGGLLVAIRWFRWTPASG